MSSSLEERLKLKQYQIDTWTTREQLCLASAVMRSGDQNWSAVSRTIRMLTTEMNRPNDWYSTKNCALQYAKLLERVDTPKRKRERGDTSNETPGEIVTKMLSKQRIEELRRFEAEEQATYNQLKLEVQQLETGMLDDQLDALWERLVQERKEEEEEERKHRQWLNEREAKIKEIQQALKYQGMKGPMLAIRKKYRQSISSRTDLVPQSAVISEASSEIDSSVNSPENPENSEENQVKIKTPCPDDQGQESEPKPTPTSPLLSSLLTKSPSTSLMQHSIASGSRLNRVVGGISPVSRALQNLVSSAISGTESPTKEQTLSISPGSVAPTLSRLLELPMNTSVQQLASINILTELNAEGCDQDLKKKKKQEADNCDLAERELLLKEGLALSKVEKTEENITTFMEDVGEKSMDLFKEKLKVKHQKDKKETTVDEIKDHDKDGKLTDLKHEIQDNCNNHREQGIETVDEEMEECDSNSKSSSSSGESENESSDEGIGDTKCISNNSTTDKVKTYKLKKGCMKEAETNFDRSLFTEKSKSKSCASILKEEQTPQDSSTIQIASKDLNKINCGFLNRQLDESTEKDNTSSFIAINLTSIEVKCDNESTTNNTEKTIYHSIKIAEDVKSHKKKEHKSSSHKEKKKKKKDKHSSHKSKTNKKKEERSSSHHEEKSHRKKEDKSGHKEEKGFHRSEDKAASHKDHKANKKVNEETHHSEELHSTHRKDENDKVYNKDEKYDAKKEARLFCSNVDCIKQDKSSQKIDSCSNQDLRVICKRDDSSSFLNEQEKSVGKEPDESFILAHDQLNQKKEDRSYSIQDDEQLSNLVKEILGDNSNFSNDLVRDETFFGFVNNSGKSKSTRKKTDEQDKMLSLEEEEKRINRVTHEESTIFKDHNESSKEAISEEEDSGLWKLATKHKLTFSSDVSIPSPLVNESDPSSPASTHYGDDPDQDKGYRSWKKPIMILWNEIAAHKFASVFLKPITDERAPGYHSIVYQPMDLQTIKRNIENGTIRNTAEFQHDIMLMFLNAIMYNSRDQHVYGRANQMMRDTVTAIEEFRNTQLLVRAAESPAKFSRRETREFFSKRVDDEPKRKIASEDKIIKKKRL